MTLDPIYADAHILVVRKPAGQVVHPAHAHKGGTLWDDILAWTSLQGESRRPGLVHRLDKDTSGLVVAARTPAAHRHLHRQFAQRRVLKGYLALVDGTPAGEPYRIATVEAPLGRAAADRRRVTVVAPADPAGSPARTDYMVLRRWPRQALLRLWPRTGRTHQLRVHLASVALPISGDPLYNPSAAAGARLFLHADYLAFLAPDGVHRTFRWPLPPDLRDGLLRDGIPGTV